MKTATLQRIAAILLSIGVASTAHANGPLRLIDRVAIPGNPLQSFDISSAANGVYAFADRSNAAVDLINTRTHQVIGQATGFTGPRKGGLGGPNGVTIVGGRQVWAGDGDSTVKVVDIATHRVIASVPTHGTKRVDELTFDPRDHLVIAANNADKPPFVTLISTRAPYAVVARITLPRATHGLEQPMWDPRTGRVDVAIPELDGVPTRGGVAVIDPRTHMLVHTWQVERCMPAGLALGPGHQLLLGCSDDAVAAGFGATSIVLDTATGKPSRVINQVGGSDEVWYDRAHHQYLLAAVAEPGGAVLGVISADGPRWLGNVASGKDAHSVAADPRTGQAFVPVAAGDHDCPNGCIKVFGR